MNRKILRSSRIRRLTAASACAVAAMTHAASIPAASGHSGRSHGETHRPVVQSAVVFTRPSSGGDERWVRVRARDADATVIAIELKYANGLRVMADGTCDTVRRGRRSTDGRQTRMDLPLDDSAQGPGYVLSARAYSVRCKIRKGQKRREQWGRFASFKLDLGPAPVTGSTGATG